MGKYFNSVTGKWTDDALAGIDLPGLDAQSMQILPEMRQDTDLNKSSLNPVVAQYLQKKMQEQPKPEMQGPNEAQPAMAPEVKKALMEKYKLLDPYQYDSDMKAAQSQASASKSGLQGIQFLAGIGDAIAGRDSSQAANDFNAIRANIDKNTVGALEQRRNAQMQNLSGQQDIQKLQSNTDMSDPASSKSIAFRKMIESQFPNVAKAYGPSWEQVSAADSENIFKPLQLKENIEARKQTAAILAGQRSDAQKAKLSEKQDKKMQMMNEIEDRRQNINTNLATLQSMIKEDGTWEAFGSHNQDMDRLMEQVATDMAKLMDPNSVARPSEVEAVKKSLIKPGFSNSNATAANILKNFENEINRRADSAYKIRGLESPSSKPNRLKAAEQSGRSNQKDAEAIAWANQNPNDPRAQQILKLHGM